MRAAAGVTCSGESKGERGERRSWALKNCWRAFPGTTQPIMVRAVERGPFSLQYTARNFFRVRGLPNLYFKHWSHDISKRVVPVVSSIFFLFSSPNLSGRRLDVCHTSTYGVVLVRI